MNKIVSFLTGAIVGGLVGATIAILMAPSSGVELKRTDPGTVDPIKGRNQVSGRRTKGRAGTRTGNIESTTPKE